MEICTFKHKFLEFNQIKDWLLKCFSLQIFSLMIHLKVSERIFPNCKLNRQLFGHKDESKSTISTTGICLCFDIEL